MAVFPPAFAEALDVDAMTNPSSSAGIGIGSASGNAHDRTMFGQYNGLRQHGGNAILDIEMVKRDNATGFWTNLSGRNIGLDNQELSFSQQRQGDWKYNINYDEITKRDIRTINTSLSGVGSTTPSVNVLPAIGTGADLDLALKRKGVTLSGEKWITPNLLFDVSFKNESKDGARLFGKGFTCTSSAATPATTCATVGGAAAWATLMLPEPINSTTKQIEAKLSWKGDKLLLTGGYYGSFYNNDNKAMTPTINGTLTNVGGGAPSGNNELMNILRQPIALPPDNQAHQFYLSGNYEFTPKTRMTFKYAYTQARQDDSFGIFQAAAPAGVSNLGGKVETNVFQIGLTMRPLSGLSLAGNLKYESKKDKTPIALYNIEGATTFTNGQLSNDKLVGKLEATYQFLPTTRGTLGLDYNTIKRDMPIATATVAGLNALRAKVDDTAIRAEVRQSMSDSLSGTLSLVTGKTRGGDWFSLAPAGGPAYGITAPASVYPAAMVYPWMVSDRNRNKLRALADWSPTESFSLQVSAEEGTDHSTMPTVRGNRGTDMNLYSIDATWAFSDNMKFTAFASRGTQSVLVQHSTGYVMDLTNTNDAVGVGLTAQPTGKLQVGADVSYSRDIDHYGQSLAADASAANKTLLTTSGGLPDVTYRASTFKIWGNYSLDKQSDIRVDLVQQNAKLDEWTWNYNGSYYFYSDRTTISMKPDQKVTFIGIRYIYKWQ